MLTYILEVSICWGAFYLLYWLLLSRETFFHFNRWYLVGTLLASLVIPVVEWQLPQRVAESEIATVYFQPITIGVEALEVTVTATAINSSIGFLEVLTWIYWAGMAFCMLRFLVGMKQIYRLYRRSEKRYRNGYQIILSEKAHPPFSFFNRLFISKSVELDADDREAILRHELAHIRGGHSIDILVLEILNALFWCSPFIYLYRRSLRNVHEYIADAAVLRTTQRKQYGHLLIRQSQSGPAIAIANHFHSQLKKRILMMMRNPSKRRAMLQYLLVLPLTLLVLLVFSNADAKASMQQQAAELQQNIEKKFDTNVQNPRVTKFSGKNFTKFEIKDGEIRFENQDGLIVEIDTIPVNRNGKISDNKVINIEIYYPNGKVEKFVDSNVKWNTDAQINPADIDKMEVTHLGDENIVKIWLKGEAKKNSGVAVGRFDEVPIFAGCEGETNPKLQQECSQKKMLEYVYRAIKYPKEARQKGIQGTVVVNFYIDEKGFVNNALISHSIGGGCDEEVLRVVNAMPRWIPRYKMGKPINTFYSLPINYKLEGDEMVGSFLPESELIDTITTFDSKTYEEKVEVKDWNNNKITVVGYKEDYTPPNDPVFERFSKQTPPISSIFDADVLQILDGKILTKKEVQALKMKFQKLGDISFEELRTMTPEAAMKKYGDKGKNGAIIYTSLKFGERMNNPGEIFKVVEEMPRFPGCEDEAGSDAEKKACADKKMLEFVYQNIKYPKEAREKGIEGITVVSFIVGKDGMIREPKIVRGIGGGCDEETLRMINLMKEQEIRWIPGKQRGRVVDVQFNLPVRFKLGEEEKLAAKNLPNADLPANTLQLQNFKASPNPTNGVLNLSFKGEKKPTVVKVFDLQGKEVQSLELKNFDGTFNERLDLSKAGKGVLIISVLQGEQSYTEKVIVQ